MARRRHRPLPPAVYTSAYRTLRVSHQPLFGVVRTFHAYGPLSPEVGFRLTECEWMPLGYGGGH